MDEYPTKDEFPNLWGMEDRAALLDRTHTHQILVQRPVYSQVAFDEGFRSESRDETFKEKFRKKWEKNTCSKSCCKNFIFSVFPFLGIMRKYNLRKDILYDIISGLTVGVMHIPQGMAYGMLTMLPPVHGLYVSFFPVIIYFFFGTSRHFSIGTFAVVCLMVGAVVQKSQPTDDLLSTVASTVAFNDSSTAAPELPYFTDSRSLGVAMALTFTVGIMQLLMGLCRLGFVTAYLSDPLISGFTTGASVHVFTSQIKHIFGVEMQRYNGAFKLVYSYISFFKNIPTTNSVTLIAAIVCIVILFVVKDFINGNRAIRAKIKMPIPIELIVVVLGTVISYFAKLNTKYGVNIVGDIPTGIPLPTPPPMDFIPNVVGDAVAIAIVAFAVSVSMAKILAKKKDYDIDANQELIAYGLCNMFNSFFSAFTCSASLSRSLVQENVGGRSQLAGLVSCVLILIVLLAVGPLFRSLPNCVLAAIILVALKGMFTQFGELPGLWRVSKIDFSIWIITFLATVLLDVDLGLGVGVGYALLTVLFRTQRPYSCLLGQVPNTDIYRDMSVYRVAQEIEGIKIFRFEASIYYANSEAFRNQLYKKTKSNPRSLKKIRRKAIKQALKDEKRRRNSLKFDDATTDHEETTMELKAVLNPKGQNNDHAYVDYLPTQFVQHIIIDCSAMSYLDSVAVKLLKTIITEYKEVDVKVLLSHCNAGVREMLDRSGFYETVDRGCMFITTHDAVEYAIQGFSPNRHIANIPSLNGGNSPLLTHPPIDSPIDDATLESPRNLDTRYLNTATQQSYVIDSERDRLQVAKHHQTGSA